MFAAYFCKQCGKTQSFLTGYCNHDEPHETFTWYDSKSYIHKIGDNKYMMEDVGCYLTRRNRRIAIKRHIMIGVLLLAVWGVLICLLV